MIHHPLGIAHQRPHRIGTARQGRQPVSALVIAQETEAAADRRHNAVPNPQIRAQRVAEDNDRGAFRPLETVVQMNVVDICHLHGANPRKASLFEFAQGKGYVN